MPGDELQAHLYGSLCFFVDFMPVNSCTQVLLHKHRASLKIVAAITAQVPEPAKLCSTMFGDDFPVNVIPQHGTPKRWVHLETPVNLRQLNMTLAAFVVSQGMYIQTLQLSGN